MTDTCAFSEVPLPLFGKENPDISKPSDNHPSYIRDHRKRLRDRFLTGGPAAVPDYELIELILFRAIPRQDVKPLARKLLEKFGNFSSIISAPAHRLKEIKGLGDSVICEMKIVEAAAHRLARSKIMQRQVLSSWDALLDYCKTSMAHQDIEQFRVLFLDTKNTLIADEAQAKGTINHVPVYPREVLKRALEINASALILVHNHPSGDPTPSQADIDMTEQILRAGETLSITLHDHLVIGQSAHFSFKSEGLL